MDNDVYGHVNNVVYYSWFDTAVNAYLIEHGALDIHAGSTIGLVIETQCNYFAPLAFPQDVHAGIRVAHMGTSSVRYEVGLFDAREEHCAAAGHFVHVYVDRGHQAPGPCSSGSAPGAGAAGGVSVRLRRCVQVPVSSTYEVSPTLPKACVGWHSCCLDRQSVHAEQGAL
jgi:acyl-CoA thioester hydrolase